MKSINKNKELLKYLMKKKQDLRWDQIKLILLMKINLEVVAIVVVMINEDQC